VILLAQRIDCPFIGADLLRFSRPHPEGRAKRGVSKERAANDAQEIDQALWSRLATLKIERYAQAGDATVNDLTLRNAADRGVKET